MKEHIEQLDKVTTVTVHIECHKYYTRMASITAAKRREKLEVGTYIILFSDLKITSTSTVENVSNALIIFCQF